MMLVERGLRVMNVEVVGDAYGIASNYLRRSGAIPDAFGTNERLLQIVVQLFQDQARQQGHRKVRGRRTGLKSGDEMEATIDRIMMTYNLLVNRSAETSAEARAKVTQYVATLFEAGEKDTDRLTVCGLTYLRELDGSSDPVKAGYTGL
jgi:hypothetical protein